MSAHISLVAATNPLTTLLGTDIQTDFSLEIDPTIYSIYECNWTLGLVTPIATSLTFIIGDTVYVGWLGFDIDHLGMNSLLFST